MAPRRSPEEGNEVVEAPGSITKMVSWLYVVLPILSMTHGWIASNSTSVRWHAPRTSRPHVRSREGLLSHGDAQKNAQDGCIAGHTVCPLASAVYKSVSRLES